MLTLSGCAHPEPGIPPHDQRAADPRYAPFFDAVKKSVGQHWDPNASLRQRDPTGNIYGGRDRYTLLSITLDTQGALREVRVEHSCGVDFLDKAAIAAFQKSAFPNPPPGLVEKDNAIRFQFGFFLGTEAVSLAEGRKRPKATLLALRVASYRNAGGTGIRERDRFETSRVS
jgi:TonB family protein